MACVKQDGVVRWHFCQLKDVQLDNFKKKCGYHSRFNLFCVFGGQDTLTFQRDHSISSVFPISCLFIKKQSPREMLQQVSQPGNLLRTLKSALELLHLQNKLTSASRHLSIFKRSCSFSCYIKSSKYDNGRKNYCTNRITDNMLLKHLKKRVQMYGPLTVADYMKEVLTNPQSGYYMNRDVFGTAGDFITSPEISQMFGEMIGVWIINEWMNHYNDKIQIVELGPGRGTLADDMLRVFAQFPNISDKVSLHLVEVSPTLSVMQGAKLSGKSTSEVADMKNDSNSGGSYLQLTSKYGPEVFWYRELADVPETLSCFIAHEFLDALPIHKFHKTEKGWREVMIDVDPTSDSLRFVLAPSMTPASIAYLQDDPSHDKNNLEVCPTAGLIVQDICGRIKRNKGFALLADYGHTGEKGGTFRAFRKHQLHDPLEDPGTADLTADVDFSYLKTFTNDDVSVFGPITQERYLNNMGIGYRLQALLQKCPQEHWSSLISGYKMLTSPEQMGERFKFMAIMAKENSNYTPAGFVALNIQNDVKK